MAALMTVACARERIVTIQSPGLVRDPQIELQTIRLDAETSLETLMDDDDFSVLDLGDTFLVRLRWLENSRVTIVSGRLVASSAQPCSAGLEALVMRVDDRVRWERPTQIENRRTLDFYFPRKHIQDEPFGMDVQLAQGDSVRCVRLPITGPGHHLTARAASPFQKWSIGSSSASLEDRHALNLGWGGGTWIGPLRFSLQLELRMKYGRPDEVGGLAAVGFEAGWGLGAELGWLSSIVTVDEEAPSSTRRDRAYGPRLALALSGLGTRAFGIAAAKWVQSAAPELFFAYQRYRYEPSYRRLTVRRIMFGLGLTTW